MANVIKGRDLKAAERYITIDGVRKKMVYNNWCYMMMEDVYEAEFHRDIGFEAILSDAAKGKLKSVMVMVYCGLQTAGETLPDFKTFSQSIGLEEIATLSAEAIEGIKDTLPEAESNAKNA